MGMLFGVVIKHQLEAGVWLQVQRACIHMVHV